MTEWFSDWLTNWLTDWLPDRLTDWLTGWLTDWLSDWVFDWLTRPTESKRCSMADVCNSFKCVCLCDCLDSVQLAQCEDVKAAAAEDHGLWCQFLAIQKELSPNSPPTPGQFSSVAIITLTSGTFFTFLCIVFLIDSKPHSYVLCWLLVCIGLLHQISHLVTVRDFNYYPYHPLWTSMKQSLDY